MTRKFLQVCAACLRCLGCRLSDHTRERQKTDEYTKITYQANDDEGMEANYARKHEEKAYFLMLN